MPPNPGGHHPHLLVFFFSGQPYWPNCEKYKLLWWGFGTFQCFLFSGCHRSEQKSWNSCFYTLCDVTRSGNLGGSWLAQRQHTTPPNDHCHRYISARSSQSLSWLWTVNVVGSKWLLLVFNALVDGLLHWLTFNFIYVLSWLMITSRHNGIITVVKITSRFHWLTCIYTASMTSSQLVITQCLVDLCSYKIWPSNVDTIIWSLVHFLGPNLHRVAAQLGNQFVVLPLECGFRAHE